MKYITLNPIKALLQVNEQNVFGSHFILLSQIAPKIPGNGAKKISTQLKICIVVEGVDINLFVFDCNLKLDFIPELNFLKYK